MTFTANITMEQAIEIIKEGYRCPYVRKEITTEQAEEILKSGKYDITTEEYFLAHDYCGDKEYINRFPEREHVEAMLEDILGIDFEGTRYHLVAVK